MEDIEFMMKIVILGESKNGGETLDIFNMAVYFAPTDIRIGVFSPIIPDKSELKDAIFLLQQLSLVQCPKETTFFVPEDVGLQARRNIIWLDKNCGFGVKEIVLKRAIRILKLKFSNYPHSLSVYTHAKGNLEVLEELDDLPGTIVGGMISDGKKQEAVEFGKECDGYLTKILGEHHRTVLNLECALGLALLEVGKREEAIKLLTASHDKACRFGHDAEVETAMNALAKVIFTGDISTDRAEKRLRRIIFHGLSVSDSKTDSDLKKWIDYTKLLFKWDVHTIKVLLILDDVIEKGSLLFRLGQDNVDTFSALEYKALILTSSFNTFLENEGMKFLMFVYEKKRKIFGSLHRETLFVKFLMGHGLVMKGDLEKAMILLEDVVTNIELVDLKSIELLDKATEEMIDIRMLQGDFVKALELSSGLHKKFVSIYGVVHPICFKYRKLNIDLFLKLDKPEKALESMKRLLEDYKYDLEEDDLESLSKEMRRIQKIKRKARSFDAPPGTLHSYAKYGNLEKVLSMIEDEKDIIESKDTTGLTPLHYASAFGHIEVAKALIGKGAKTPSKAPFLPLEEDKESKIITLFKTVQSFFEAVKTDDCDNVIGIASREPCVLGARDDQGCTPLHWAALRGYGGVFKLLLEFGSDPTAISDKGNSPLHIAASKGHSAIVEALLTSLGPAGATAALDGRTGTGGNTPLHAAAEKGHVATVRSLLAHGAVCDPKNAAGKSPLQLCGDWGCRNLLGLVEGLFLDTSKGDVAAVCAKLRDLEPADLLAVSKARNRDHRTLMQEALKLKNPALVKKLVKLFKYNS